jgi:hypothetical protein
MRNNKASWCKGITAEAWNVLAAKYKEIKTLTKFLM